MVVTVRRRRTAGTALLALVAPFLHATSQVQQAAKPVVLAPTASAAAAAEYRTALDEAQSWSFTSAAARAKRAVALDSSFGLARGWLARLVAGPTQLAEGNRGAADAAKGSAPEALIALAYREVTAGRTPVAMQLLALASRLVPDDSAIALEQVFVMPDSARPPFLRELAQRYPGFAAPRMWLAFYLTLSALDTVPAAVATEALNAATDALRLAPKSGGAHTALAHVLLRTGQRAEAARHLAAAGALPPHNEYTYVLKAELAGQEGRIAEQRAAIDSSITLTPHVGRSYSQKIARAFTFLSEGDVRRTRAELEAIARDAEAQGLGMSAAAAHRSGALAAAATRDTAAVRRHLVAALKFPTAPIFVADNELNAYAVAGMGADARRVLGDYARLAASMPPNVRDANIHRMTGLTLLAEGKPAEAIEHLRRGGTNPYATLGIIDAYLAMGKKREADAERSAFFERKMFSYTSSAVPIIRYRARK